MVTAAVTGAVDFKTYDGSDAWWRVTRLKLGVVHAREVERVYAADVVRASLVQAMVDSGISPAERQDFALSAYNRLRGHVLPWLPAAGTQNTSDPLDAIAQWYAMFAPEMLKKPNG